MSAVRVRIARGAPGEEPRVEEHEVPYDEGMTALDALIWLRRHVDPSLAVRFSCRANACKECSASIDGRPGYLCTTRLTAGGAVELAPLPKPRLIRDLVTELG